MPEIKAIETEYNGYKFRSRLEARWAVFFDVGKIRYEYEPEGFVLPDGTHYLPDFYLPDYDTYVEVKRDTAEGISEVRNKCPKLITWGGPAKQILILSDIPEGKSMDGGIWHFPIIYWRGTSAIWGWWFFYDIGDEEGQPIIGGTISKAGYSNPEWWLFIRKGAANSISAISDYTLRFRQRNHSELIEAIESQMIANELTFKAYRTAKQARFEHGETPNIFR